MLLKISQNSLENTCARAFIYQFNSQSIDGSDKRRSSHGGVLSSTMELFEKIVNGFGKHCA